MGATLTAIQAGSTAYIYVAAIEGCPYLLTSGTPAQALAAWTGTDWTEALGGLFVEIKNEQSLNPDEPFTSGGQCSLSVVPDASDLFGLLVGRKTGGAKTYLSSTLERTATTANVKSTAALPSSGEVHIGPECIGYSGKTSTTLTGLTRGKYSPFTANDTTPARFSHRHRVGLDAQSINLQPTVSELPRVWVGRWVGVWAHRVVEGAIDTKAQSYLMFAGRVDELRDDPNTFATVVHCTPVLDVIKEITIGRNLWEGIGQDGVYLAAGMVFGAGDSTTTAGLKTANVLTVVSGAPSTNQIAEGWYSAIDICSAVSAWLNAESVAARLTGSYSMAVSTINVSELRTKIYWILYDAANASWGIHMPAIVASFLGFEGTGSPPSTYSSNVQVGRNNPSPVGIQAHFYQDREPQRIAISMTGEASSSLRYVSQTGDLVDQYDRLPGVLKPPAVGGDEWGLFIIGDRTMVTAEISQAGTLRKIRQAVRVDAPGWFPGNAIGIGDPITVTASSTDPIRIRQVFAFEGSLEQTVMRMLMSTGESGFNHTSYDVLPNGAGAAIPFEVLSGIITTIGSIPGSTSPLIVFIDKPTKLAELLRSDLIMRWAFFYWAAASVKIGTWRTPVAAFATVTLSDANKAAPSGTEENHRSATATSREWHRPTSLIRYSRDITSPQSDEYRSTFKFVDQSSLSDTGGEGGIRTISMRNIYGEASGTGQSVEFLLAGYMALAPLVSRPANVLTRSIDHATAHKIAIGDIVLVSDLFARDPSTGERTLTSRPAIVKRLNFSPGGWLAGSDSAISPMGEVDLFFSDIDPERSGIAYVPSADVDETAGAGGFDAGYDSTSYILRCYPHRYSESTEVVDASNMFGGDKVRIIERDPLDANAPLYWDATIDSVNSSDITLTGALSGWDNAKRYRVIFQDWDAVLASQQSKVFQADDGDGLILDDGEPFLYVATGADPVYTVNSSTEIELPPTISHGDGKGRDVGHEQAMVRAIDNYIDYKSAIQHPVLFASETSNTTVTGTSYRLVWYQPIYLSYEVLTGTVFRDISVAPWARSTDGTSTKIRISLCLNRPSSNTLTNYDRGPAFSYAEWTGITSTTAAIQSAKILRTTANIKSLFTGMAYLVLELGYKCASRGVARFSEGVRSTV